MGDVSFLRKSSLMTDCADRAATVLADGADLAASGIVSETVTCSLICAMLSAKVRSSGLPEVILTPGRRSVEKPGAVTSTE